MLKVAVPLVAIFDANHPVQMLGILAGLFLATSAAHVVWSPFLDIRTTIGMRGYNFLLTCIMLCGLYSAILDDPSQHEPSICLCLSLVVVPSVTLWCMSRQAVGAKR